MPIEVICRTGSGPLVRLLCCASGAAASIAHAGPALVESHWLQPVGGSWTVNSAWSTPLFPNNSNGGGPYHAIINATGAPYTVTTGLSNLAVSRLTLDSADATLQVNGATSFSAAEVTLAAGVLRFDSNAVFANSVVDVAGGALRATSARLNNVQVAGRLDFETGGDLYLNTATYIDHLRSVGVNTDLYFDPGCVVQGEIEILSGMDMRVTNSVVSDVTVGPGGVVRAAGGSSDFRDSIRLTNDGLIETIGANTDLSIFAATLDNRGVIRSNGGEIIVQTGGTWFNSGVIDAADGRLVLRGTLDATAGLGTIRSSGGELVFGSGVIMNAGNTIVLDAATGVWRLDNARIEGGVLDIQTGGGLHIESKATLKDVQVASVLDHSTGALVLQGDTRFPELRLIGDCDVEIATTYTLRDTITGAGASGSLFRPSSSNAASLTIAEEGVLQVAEGSIHEIVTTGNLSIVNHGLIANLSQDSIVAIGGASLLNHGTVAADGDLSITATTSQNHGLYTVKNGDFRLAGDWTNAGGVIELENVAARLDGTFSTSDLGTILRTNVTFDLGGTMDNTAAVLALGAEAPQWRISGEIVGGTIDLTGGGPLQLDGELSDVQVNGDIDIVGSSTLHGQTRFQTAHLSATTLYLDNTFTLHDVILFEGEGSGAASLEIIDTITLEQTARVEARGVSHFGIENSRTLINRGLILAESGVDVSITTDRVSNEGTIRMDGASLTIDPGMFAGEDFFENTGVLELVNGASGALIRNWSNPTGVISVHDSTLALRGAWSLANMGALDLSNARIDIGGTIQNSGNTFDLPNASAARWALSAPVTTGLPGTITGGAITSSAGAALHVDGGSFELIDIDIDAPLEIHGGSARLIGSTTVSDVSMSGGAIRYQPNTTLDDVILGFGADPLSRTITAASGSLTFGAAGGVLLPDGAGGAFRLGTSGQSLVANYGAIDLGTTQGDSRISGVTVENHGQVDVRGGSLEFLGGSVLNSGVVSVTNAALEFDLTGAFQNDGAISVLDGELLLTGPSWSGSGTTSATDSRVELRGAVSSTVLSHFTLDNVSVDLVGNFNTFGADIDASFAGARWRMLGGTLVGGSVTVADDGAFRLSDSGGIVQNVRIYGELTVDADNASADLLGSTRFDRAVVSGADTVLRFGPNRTIFGALIASGDGAKVVGLNTPGSLTIDAEAEVSLRGKGQSNILLLSNYAGAMHLINDGRIVADSPAGLLRAAPTTMTNNGRIESLRGELEIATPSLLNFGTISADGGMLTIDAGAVFTNAGEIGVGPDGRVVIHGDLAQQSSATIAARVVRVQGESETGLIEITGAASLDGALRIDAAKGLRPAWGDSWTIMSFASITGGFSDFVLPLLGDSDLTWWSEATDSAFLVGVRHVADLDHDGLIGFSDLNRVISNFNAPGDASTGDVDGDGFVGFADLNIILDVFNVAAPTVVPAPAGAALLVLAPALARRRRCPFRAAA